MGQYGGYSILSQKLFAVIVPEAFGPEMLWAEAGVCSRNKVFHAQVLHPFGSKLRFAEREPEKHKGTITHIKQMDLMLQACQLSGYDSKQVSDIKTA